MPEYVVKNEHTLGYIIQDGDWPLVGILHGSGILGGHDWRNGPVTASKSDLRSATVKDFENFRVSLPSDFVVS